MQNLETASAPYGITKSILNKVHSFQETNRLPLIEFLNCLKLLLLFQAENYSPCSISHPPPRVPQSPWGDLYKRQHHQQNPEHTLDGKKYLQLFNQTQRGCDWHTRSPKWIQTCLFFFFFNTKKKKLPMWFMLPSEKHYKSNAKNLWNPTALTMMSADLPPLSSSTRHVGGLSGEAGGRGTSHCFQIMPHQSVRVGTVFLT